MWPTLSAIAAQIRARRGVPVVHQNGFIQLDVDGASGFRVHVWPDGKDGEVRHQRTSSPIHDHRRPFESYVLAGRLTNVTYEVVHDRNGYYRIHLADGILIPTDIRCGAVPAGTHEVLASEAYRHPARVFHLSLAEGLTATLMRKGPVAAPESRARVLCPWDEAPDNEYRRDENDRAMLWRYIERAIL